jgi:hemoglobin-like flavoprotein
MYMMIDVSVDFLGPDLSPLMDDTIELGSRHVAYGIDPKYFHTLALGAIYALKNLVKSFSDEDEDAWTNVFCFIIRNMAIGYRREEARRANAGCVDGK